MLVTYAGDHQISWLEWLIKVERLSHRHHID